MKNLDPNKFVNAVEELYAAAINEAIDLLKNNEQGQFIALTDCEMVEATIEYQREDVEAGIWAVGVKKDGKLYVKASPNLEYDAEDMPKKWIKVDKVNKDAYPDIYRFVAQYLDEATSEKEANKVEADGIGFIF